MIDINVFLSCPANDPVLEGLPEKLIKVTNDYNNNAVNKEFNFIVSYWEKNEFVDADTGKTPQQIIMDKVGEYDLYFGIMASRYGKRMAEEDISATEFEFRDALKRKNEHKIHIHPRIISFSFLQQSEDLFSKDKSENQKIESFLGRVGECAVYKICHNQDEIIELFKQKLKECIKTSCRKYDEPEDYVIDLKISAQNEKVKFWQTNYLDLDTVIKEKEDLKQNKKIIIMDNGGSGKSTYLCYYAYLYSNDLDKFNPVLIKLKNLISPSIEEAVKEELKSFPDNLILLLDGYDELKDDRKLEFHQQLNNWNEKYPDIPIVITSRPIDLSTTPMRDYTIYSMAPLTYEQIKKYTTDRLKNIDLTTSPLWNEISPLIQSPFYLVKIVDYYQQSGNLPGSISEILDFAIKESIEQDREHFETTHIPDCVCNELVKTMSKLAFCMTDCGLTTISKKDIKFITADLNLVEEVRKYQKLIEFNEINGDLQYSFSHKIFQDYLSAQAFKNIKSKDELNYLFASDLILYNWEPVVPFIVELLPKDYKNYLIEQIKTSKPESLINILPEFMVYEKQKEIFIFIFEYYSTNWKFIPGYINLRNLSRIWNTPERENYLLNYIRKPENNNYMTITAFVILSYATNFNKPEIDKTLIECMMREDLKSYRKNLNYIATNYIDIDNLPFETLKKLYKASKNDTVQLLTKYDPDFYYLDDMLDLYKELSEQNKQNQETSELLCFIKDYYLNCCKSSHFNEFVNGFIKKDMLKYNYNYSFDLMKDIVNIAIDGSKEEKIYENMYRLFLYFCESQSLVDDIVTLSTYFQSIGKGYELVERIFKENKQGYYAYLLITLFQEDDNFVRRICKELFPSLDNDTKTNLVKLLAIYQVNPLYEELLNEYSELFMETRKNNILARKTARFQRDMEIILNLDLLIEDLNSIFGLAEVLTKEEYYKKDILTFSELIHNLLSDYFRKNSKANREEMEQQLKHKYEELVLNFVDSHFVQKLPITEENKENIPKLTPELSVWLQNWAKESIEKVDIKNASNYITDNDKKIKKLWNFGKADFIQIPNQIWLDFITLINDSDWEVIEKKVADKSLLKNRVLENLQNKREMLPNIIMNHISFCVRNKCSEVLPHIYEIMENWENDYNKKMSLLYSCLNALINLDIDENWFNAYVLKCPENIVFYLANYFAGYKKTMPGLIERIKKEIQDKKCEYYRKYIYYLCCFGDKDALPLYIEIIKEEKKFVYDPEHINPLEEYTNKAYLEPLLDLLDFSFANNIEQSPYISLIVSVLTNLEIIALTDDMLNIVVEKLNCYKDKYKDHPEIYRIHFSISRIKTEFQRQYINSKKLNDALAKYNELQQK